MNREDLNEVLRKHELWLKGDWAGERADLSDMDLKNIDLSFKNLAYATLCEVDLSNACLIGANLSNACLVGANLSNACLNRANLSNACLIGANLSNVCLVGANLSNACLNRANLSNACLENTNLTDVKYDEQTAFFALQCPEKGAFIGYKKAKIVGSLNVAIVELQITEDSLRSSATSRKCRCSKAKVLSITDIMENVECQEAVSGYDRNFIYKVGEIVEVKDFDTNRWEECAAGIHFFITRDEAVHY